MSKWSKVVLLVLLVLVSAMALRNLALTGDAIANGGAPVPPTPWLVANGGAPVPPTPWLVANGGAPVPPTPWKK